VRRPPAARGERVQREQAAVALAAAGARGVHAHAIATDAGEAETVALPQGDLDGAGGQRAGGPGPARVVALGLADEVAVGARVQLPVHLARLVPGLVGAVLR